MEQRSTAPQASPHSLFKSCLDDLITEDCKTIYLSLQSVYEELLLEFYNHHQIHF